jgi:aspartate-semialdehyde dehydrogenase
LTVAATSTPINSANLPSRALRVAILGVTGAVGKELLELLVERQFPVAELIPLASERSAGQQLHWQGEKLPIQAVSEAAFESVDLVLASAGGAISKQWAPAALRAGAVMIDNSSAFRLDPAVPLVVPEVNPQAAFSHQGIIANPNCTTILLTLALAPLASRRPIRRHRRRNRGGLRQRPARLAAHAVRTAARSARPFAARRGNRRYRHRAHCSSRFAPVDWRECV